MIIEQEADGTFTYSGVVKMDIDFMARALEMRWDLNLIVWNNKG